MAKRYAKLDVIVISSLRHVGGELSDGDYNLPIKITAGNLAIPRQKWHLKRQQK